MVSSRSFSLLHYHPFHSSVRRLCGCTSPEHSDPCCSQLRIFIFFQGTEAVSTPDNKDVPRIWCRRRTNLDAAFALHPLLWFPSAVRIQETFIHQIFFGTPPVINKHALISLLLSSLVMGIKSGSSASSRNEHRQKASGCLCARKPSGQHLTIAQPGTQHQTFQHRTGNCPVTSGLTDHSLHRVRISAPDHGQWPHCVIPDVARQ